MAHLTHVSTLSCQPRNAKSKAYQEDSRGLRLRTPSQFPIRESAPNDCVERGLARSFRGGQDFPALHPSSGWVFDPWFTGRTVNHRVLSPSVVLRVAGLTCEFSFLRRAGDEMTRLIKFIWPKAASHEVRRRARAMYLALAFGIITAGAIAGFLYWIYFTERFRP